MKRECRFTAVLPDLRDVRHGRTFGRYENEAKQAPGFNPAGIGDDCRLNADTAAAEGVEKTPTTISTVPQYVKSGETLISNDTSGASTAKSLDYGTPVYFLLRTASGSAGNIADPDYVDPAKFDITFSGTQGVDTGGLALVKESSVGGVFWYLKVPLIEQGSLTGDTAVQGSIVIAPKAGGTSFTLNLTARNITLRAAVTGDQPIVSLATQAQAMGKAV